MAGHSQFANIKHRKGAQDKKKAKLFTKILREITVAAKSGADSSNVDQNSNPRLRNAMIEARVNNIPKDRIDAAIKKASGQNDAENFEEIRYEGYGFGGVAIIVEALTDNRNRTASEVRSIFTKFGGNLGETNSVAFMFSHLGLIQYSSSKFSENEILETALELGAVDVASNEELHNIFTKIEDFIRIRDKLIEKFEDPISAKISWIAKNPIIISDEEQLEKLEKMLDLLEDCDDVQNVYSL